MGQKKAEVAPSLPLKKNTPPGLPVGVFLLLQKRGAVVLGDVRIEIRNYSALKKKLADKKKAPQKVMKALYSDAVKRVPGWVATEVTKNYGVKKGEVTGKKLGTLKIKGNGIEDVQFIYSGRMLTHTHFSMSPKQPKAGSYTLKATIIKGQRATLGKVKKLTKKQRAALAKNFTRSGMKSSSHSPIMLMRANGGQYLPFQRISQRRKDIVVRKAISLPQMISSERTEPGVYRAISGGLDKRLDHHLDRYM